VKQVLEEKMFPFLIGRIRTMDRRVYT